MVTIAALSSGGLPLWVLLFAIVMLAFGIVAVVEGHRNWAGWGVIAGALALLIPQLF